MIRIILAALAALSLSAPAFAGDWYVGTYGGANFDDVIDHPVVHENTGVVIGGVVGTSVKSVPGLRVEADVSFRQNDVDVGPFCGPCSFVIHASHETFAVMGNAVYDFPTKSWPVHPYVLVGAGYANTAGIFENIAIAKVEASGFAWQLGAGLNANVADGVVVGLGYRYFQAPEINVFGAELSDGSNHAVIAELKFALGEPPKP